MSEGYLTRAQPGRPAADERRFCRAVVRGPEGRALHQGATDEGDPGGRSRDQRKLSVQTKPIENSHCLPACTLLLVDNFPEK